MKRNSMLTKIIAVLLCALMVAAWLPKTSAAANDFESGMDRIYGTDAANAMPLVIGTNADSGLANAYYAYTPAEDGTLTLTAEDGTTFTVDGVAYTDAVAVTAGTKYIIVATNEAKAYSFTAAFEAAPTGPILDENLEFDSLALSLQAYICAQYEVKPAYIASVGFDKVYVVVNHNGNIKTLDKNLVPNMTDDYGNPRYVFELELAAKEMTDIIELTVYAEKDGQVYYGNPVTWSIKQGLLERLSTFYPYINHASMGPTYRKICTLCVDMLVYGAAAQELFDYNTDNLATDNVDTKYMNMATQGEVVIGDVNTPTSSAVYGLYNCTLVAESKILTQFTFRLASKDYTGYTIKVTHGDDVTEYTADYFKPYMTGYEQFAYIEYDKLDALQMREMVTVELYKNGTLVSSSYNMSIEGCAYSRVNQTENPELAALSKAVIIYGDSAKAFMG